ncbi:chondroitin sulfate proteoglycan 4-like [Aquarana catesbeiana]|uniref:chondroitin sulfate proteoglycan 4-like n=1 Tax=Aquarana catesbeiana TaxID=8400 RepID=UPI003CC99C29
MTPGVTFTALCVLGALLHVRAASFYGESYVELKKVESFSKISLQLRFRTSKADGLLFLAAGKNDYFLVGLHAGRVQVKMNFGKGELVLSFDQGTHLDDLEWHLIKISHEDTNITLTVDTHVKSDIIVGGSNTFNIHGLYVGGFGSLKVPYAKDMHAYFRGCLDDVIFNEYDLLSNLRPYAGLKNVHEVSLGCSDEFFISEEDPISLFSSKSYLAFPRWNMEDDAVWECFLQPSVGRGLLMYQSGKGEYYISLEIIDWVVRASIGKGNNIAHLDFPSSITENKWQYIKLTITSKHFHLTVGEKTEKALLPSRVKTHGPMYVGGVSDVSREHVKHLRLTSLSGKHSKGGSFKGCIKNIKVNSGKLAYRNALSTKDISPGCKTEAALSTVPTLEVKTVLLTLAPITSHVPTVVTKKNENVFLTLNNLVVQEGSKSTLQSKHIKLNLNFKELGIRQSQILFKVVEYPLHGQLKFDVSSQEKGMFTMLDLWHGRITYAHDGTEGSSDQFSFSVTTNSKNEMPPYLRGETLYVLNITVTPSNDAPELSLPEGNLFTLLENSKKCLTGNLINISDVDSEPKNLHLVILGNLNVDAGFLENVKDPEKAITTFSYSDLLEGHIYYVHRGVKNSRLVLRVSDGDKVSNTVVLRILAIPLEFKVENNTGIEVIQGGNVLIQPRNLAVKTNAVNQDIEIKFDVTEMPKFGQIQRRSSANEWKPAVSFTQRSLERDRIRYLNTYKEIQEADVIEKFQFKITVANKSSEELIFPIKVQWLKYTLLKNIPLKIENTEKTIFGVDNLRAIVEGIRIDDKHIFFKLESVPTKGNILSKNKVLSKNSVFSQIDIIEGNIEYKLNDQPREDAQDSFKLIIFTKYAQSKTYNIRILITADLNSIILTNKGLSLGEGETKLITKDELFAQTLNNKTFSFKVLRSPLNGKLKLINFSTSLTSNDNITVFSTQDILGERLMYVHDDSETLSDGFVVLASSESETPANPIQIEFTFNISIELKNDEKPIRVVDKLFHVVRNGQRLLTLEDLCYHDPDTDFDDAQLLYTRRGIPNGDLVSSDDTSKKLYQFTQDDLKNKRVLFTHQGGAYGRFVLFVTDGKHYTSSLLEITASEPFIKIINNTGLLVQKGKDKVITTANFSIATNMYVNSESDIRYSISLPPKHGKIFRGKQASTSFTHEDLKNGHVAYKHNDGNHLSDAFTVTVKIDTMSVEVEIKVRVYLESHQRLPTVQNLKSLMVEEGRPVKIDKDKLQVVHEDNAPGEIVFTVVTPPRYGYIRRFESLVHRFPDDLAVMVFTQEDINNGDIQYVQTEAGQLQDNFTLDVTNGVREIMGITVSVDIIPIQIPLEVQNITVKEGASKALTEEYLRIPSKHFQNINSAFVLVDPPAHGYIENTRFPGIKLSTFTKKQVEQELIYYAHDGSETLQDNFTIILNNTEVSKQSLPRSIFVSVIPINDEYPVITSSNIFLVWVGSVTEVTSNDLLAEDKDTSPADLVFFITPPSNGHLSLKSHPDRSILNFTQQHINNGQLVFVHNGPMSGGFNFQVTDGLNFAPRQIFSITARTLVINLEVNKGLAVFPGTRRVLSSGLLKAVTNDQSDINNRTITFQVSSPPKHGRILKLEQENATSEVATFTQSMVDNAVIFYEHTDTEALVWSTQDSFSFTVSSPPAVLENQKFLITISYEIDDPDRPTRLIANTGASVLEGEKIQIDKTKLDASNLLVRLPETQRAAYEVWFQVTILPKHGVIIVGDRNITKDKPNFSQYIVNKFGITYAHNGAESPTDNFTFATWLNLKSKSAIKPDFDILEEMFNITVIPVNDQPPELKTKRPNLRVLQGKIAAFSPENLNVEDLDNPPEDITYSVISAPNNGFLAKLDNLNESIQHFTQADINNGDLWFVPDGSPSSGVFYFSVTDGKHKPLYKLFNLDVTPVSITLVNKTNLVLVQGQTYATITTKNLAATTDGKSPVIHYAISQTPMFGRILVHNTLVTNFDQREIESGKVVYHMNNFTASQDSLELMVFTSESNLTGQVLNITVEPLVNVVIGLKIPTGLKYTLKTGDLNATELANRTSSDPEYYVVDAPAYGKLVRRKTFKKEEYEEIEKFTHSDIEARQILLDVDANVTDQEMINDSFAFMLNANNVPPALGYFAYSVVPYDPVLVDSSPTAESFSFTTAALLYTSLSHEKKTTSHWLHRNITEAPIRRFGNQNRWGNQRHDEPTLPLEIATTSSSGHKTTIKQTTDDPKAEPSQTDPLSIIIPLVVVAVLLLVVIFIVWFLLKKRREKKAPPHVRSHSYSMVPQVPSPYMERSTTVPTVTVTPLQKPNDYCSASPLLPPRHGHLLANSAPSFGANTDQKTWLQMDPEMIQHCRKTNPTLRNNQYWV